MSMIFFLCICEENDVSSLERILRNGKVDGVVLLRTFLHDAQIELLSQKENSVCYDRFYHVQKSKTGG